MKITIKDVTTGELHNIDATTLAIPCSDIDGASPSVDTDETDGAVHLSACNVGEFAYVASDDQNDDGVQVWWLSKIA